MIGYEGAAGGIVSAGNSPASARMQVLCGGTAWWIPTDIVEELKWKSQNLHNIFSRYGDLLLAQTMQSVACNAVHTIEQRCSRWLLCIYDRVRSGQLNVTQELLAALLGVQRTTISSAAQAFRAGKSSNTAEDGSRFATARRSRLQHVNATMMLIGI